jgi:hypothetical protein
VSIHDNFMGSNIAYDDGGAIRFLEAGVAQFDVVNNMITNNVSAHEGGGIAIDNAPNVRLVNDTIANNLTTATAATSTGDPAPAGVSTTAVSGQMMKFLNGNQTIEVDTPNGTVAAAKCADVSSVCANLAGSKFSNPVMFNDVIWDNLAGSWDWNNSTVVGACLPSNGRAADGVTPNNISPCQFTKPTGFDVAGEPTGTGYLVSNPQQLNNLVDGSGPNVWDVGTADSSLGTNQLQPSHSLLSSPQGWNSGSAAALHDVVAPNNANADPLFVQQYITNVQSDQYRLQYRFRPGTLITLNLPAGGLGDYHLQSQSSSAYRLGAHTAPAATVPSGEVVTAPHRDIDFDTRPPSCPDSGADQLISGEAECGDGGQGGGFGAGIGFPGGPGAGGGAPAGGGSGNGAPGSGGAGGAPAGGGKGAVLTNVRLPDVSHNHTHIGTQPVSAPPSAHAPGTAAAPTGAVGGFRAAGDANGAGNTAVVALPGSGTPSRYGTSSGAGAGTAGTYGSGGATGAAAVGPSVQPAGMPGGTAGGGHFTLPRYRHHPAKSKGGLAWWLWAIPALAVGSGAVWITGLRRRRRPPRHLRGGTSGQPVTTSPPPDDDPATGRQLVPAGKGDQS